MVITPFDYSKSDDDELLGIRAGGHDRTKKLNVRISDVIDVGIFPREESEDEGCSEDDGCSEDEGCGEDEGCSVDEGCSEDEERASRDEENEDEWSSEEAHGLREVIKSSVEHDQTDETLEIEDVHISKCAEDLYDVPISKCAEDLYDFPASNVQCEDPQYDTPVRRYRGFSEGSYQGRIVSSGSSESDDTSRDSVTPELTLEGRTMSQCIAMMDDSTVGFRDCEFGKDEDEGLFSRSKSFLNLVFGDSGKKVLCHVVLTRSSNHLCFFCLILIILFLSVLTQRMTTNDYRILQLWNEFSLYNNVIRLKFVLIK